MHEGVWCSGEELMIMMIKRKTTVFAFEFSLLMSTGEEEERSMECSIVVRTD